MGSNVEIGGNVKIFGQGHIVLGNDVWLGRGAELTVPAGASVVIGNSVDIGPNVKFMCGGHKLGSSKRRAGKGTSENIEIQDGCWIGTEVLILGGVCIQHGSVVAAGSVVVSGSYPANVLLAGSPARIVKSLLGGPEPE